MSMDWFGDLFGLWFPSLIGFGVFFGLLYLSVNLQANMWRSLVTHHGNFKYTPVIARKTPETIVISKAGYKGLRLGWRQSYGLYSWTIISVLEDGLLISAIPPVNLVCKDIYLPFDVMNIEPHPWMLWQEPYAISIDKTSDIIVIIGQDTLQWIRQHTGRPPFYP